MFINIILFGVFPVIILGLIVVYYLQPYKEFKIGHYRFLENVYQISYSFKKNEFEIITPVRYFTEVDQRVAEKLNMFKEEYMAYAKCNLGAKIFKKNPFFNWYHTTSGDCQIYFKSKEGLQEIVDEWNSKLLMKKLQN